MELAMAKPSKADLPFDVFMDDYYYPVINNPNRTIEELNLLQDHMERRIMVYKALQIKFNDYVYVPFGKDQKLVKGQVYGVSRDGVTVEGEFGKRKRIIFPFDKVLTEEEYNKKGEE